MLAHADYFSEIHSTIRVFDTSIQFQNPGCFPVNLSVLGQTIVSQPRNPNILRFFKLARLSENGGYGIDKILNWENITGSAVSINSDITKSEVRFELPINANQCQSASELTSNQRQSTSDDVEYAKKTLFELVLTLIDRDSHISIVKKCTSNKPIQAQHQQSNLRVEKIWQAHKGRFPPQRMVETWLNHHVGNHFSEEIFLDRRT